jgi:hypothetical protein
MAVKNRDVRDKCLVTNRVGQVVENPLTVNRQSAAYIPESQRLRSDIGKQLHDALVVERQGKQEIINQLKGERKERDLQRWEKEESLFLKAEREAKALAGSGKRNLGSVGYDLIGGRWGNSNDAAVARYQDDLVEYSCKLRSQRLDHKSNSSSFNVINGLDRTKINVPPRPQKPILS